MMIHLARIEKRRVMLRNRLYCKNHPHPHPHLYRDSKRVMAATHTTYPQPVSSITLHHLLTAFKQNPPFKSWQILVGLSPFCRFWKTIFLKSLRFIIENGYLKYSHFENEIYCQRILHCIFKKQMWSRSWFLREIKRKHWEGYLTGTIRYYLSDYCIKVILSFKSKNWIMNRFFFQR